MADSLQSPSPLVGNYGTPQAELVRGQGAYVWTADGRRLLDFGTGIAVNALGHCHPHWVEAVQRQAATLCHVSNLYQHAPGLRLAERLSGYAGAGRVLFTNSGAEANEALLKLARLHGRRTCGQEGQRYEVITAKGAFHGRTFGAMAATPQEKIQGGFRPMLPGFAHAELNDLDGFEAAITERTAAILIEPIQGEGGIRVADDHFLQQLRQLCDSHGLLLMFDEVQCGTGRTGQFFAHQHGGVKPDALAMAKGLGGGFPIGAIWIAEPHHDLFQPGSHGTTYGGNPLACAAASAVLDVIERDDLLAQIRHHSIHWHASLEALARKHPALIAEVRGRGYMVGLRLNIAPIDLCKAVLEQGMLTVPAADQTLRLLPPLIADKQLLEDSVALLDLALQHMSH